MLAMRPNNAARGCRAVHADGSGQRVVDETSPADRQDDGCRPRPVRGPRWPVARRCSANPSKTENETRIWLRGRSRDQSTGLEIGLVSVSDARKTIFARPRPSPQNNFLGVQFTEYLTIILQQCQSHGRLTTDA